MLTRKSDTWHYFIIHDVVTNVSQYHTYFLCGCDDFPNGTHDCEISMKHQIQWILLSHIFQRCIFYSHIFTSIHYIPLLTLKPKHLNA